MPSFATIRGLFQTDPFLGYTLLAALFLSFVSLAAGWSRLDFMVFAKPRVLLKIALAVALALLLLLLSQSLTGFGSSLLAGLSRFPLYLIALAYGPSSGLLAAGLLVAGLHPSNLPAWSEVVIALELVIVGWFAIEPSPFRQRWAGPLNGVLAYLLAWATGGSALLESLTHEATKLSTHWAYHQPRLLGFAITLLLLALIGPRLYQRFFGISRIATLPQTVPAVETTAVELIPATPTPISPSAKTYLESFPNMRQKPPRQPLEALPQPLNLGTKTSRDHQLVAVPSLSALHKAQRLPRSLEPVLEPAILQRPPKRS